MEFHLFSPTNLIPTFSIILLLFLFQFLKQKTGKNQNQNPPQVKGAWPILGHLHLLNGSKLPHKVLGDIADNYGPIFTIKLGVHLALVVSDGEIAKECFTTKDKVFASRPNSLVIELMGYNHGLFGLGPYGDYWRQMRKIMMVELLSQRKVEMLGYIRVSEVRASMKGIFEAWVRKNDKNMVCVEMKQLFEHLSLNIVSRMVFGKRFSADDEVAVRVHEIIRRFFELLGIFMVSDFVPYMKYLDLGGYVRGMKTAAKEMDNILEEWLEEHKKRREPGRQDEDLMDALITIVEGTSKQDFPGFDHDTVIKANSLQILQGALDTTAVTSTWMLSLLLNHPEALQRAQDEVDVHVGRERLVEDSDIKNLVYLQAIIKETLRLYPASPLSVARESMDDCIVAGYKIPKGTRLMTNLWKLHRDPGTWSDPDEFRPERFLTNQKDVDVKGKHFELLPFGSGRRMCPGATLALRSMSLTLATLIQEFELAKPSKEPIDMTESLGITNMKATPLEVLLKPRLSAKLYAA